MLVTVAPAALPLGRAVRRLHRRQGATAALLGRPRHQLRAAATAAETQTASEAQAVVTALVCVGPQARRSVRGSADCNWRPQLR
jgi:hypothetical protein